MWEVLDLFGDCADEINDRYTKLQTGLRKLFEDKVVNATQIQQTLEHARQDIFGHLHLYMTCISMAKQQKEVKQISIFQEVPQLVEEASLTSNCQEILDEQPVQTAEAAEEQQEAVEQQLEE